MLDSRAFLGTNRTMSVPLLYESHCHTPLCKHAFGQPGEYAARAEAREIGRASCRERVSCSV